MSITDLKPRVRIEYNGEPYEVITSSFSRSSQSKGYMITRIRNLLTGSITDTTFREKDTFDIISLEKRITQFLYSDGNAATFMDNETFEQFEIPADVLGDKQYFIKEGDAVSLLFYKEKPISIEIQPKVTLLITEAEPGVRGSTVSDVKKQAVTETGYKLQVPSFINTGDKIKVNTDTGLYAERA